MKHKARAIVQGKVNSPGQGKVQMYKSSAKGKDKGVAACQGNSQDKGKAVGQGNSPGPKQQLGQQS